MSKFLEELLPKALLGALIPLAQFLWQQYQQRGPSWRKTALRKTAIDLSQQLTVFPRLTDSAAAETARRDLEAELEATLASLAALTTLKPRAKTTHPSGRSWAARWFLLYAPHGFGAWIVHVLFFVNVAFVLLGTIGLLADLT